ncbi:MAG: TIGR00295 family protein [Methanophagales archaeon]|nr:TIGR00295 family protein [Methanophagales archaeon]
MEEGDKKRIRSECIKLLREVGCDESVVEHCIAVAELALEIALHHNHSEGYNSVDEKLIFEGALLHDIGRARSHGVDHGFVGGEMAKELGLEEKVVRIIQRHVGAGITAEEGKEMGLPPVDFVPETMEEKIVSCADNLIDGGRRTSIENAIEDLKDKLGETHPSIKRMIRLHKEVMGRSG